MSERAVGCRGEQQRGPVSLTLLRNIPACPMGFQPPREERLSGEKVGRFEPP